MVGELERNLGVGNTPKATEIAKVDPHIGYLSGVEDIVAPPHFHDIHRREVAVSDVTNRDHVAIDLAPGKKFRVRLVGPISLRK